MRTMLCALVLVGCGEFPPFEPGSDLQEVDAGALVPDAMAMTGSDVTGTFDMTGNVMAAGMPIEVGFLGRLTQAGVIMSGEATLQIELLDEDAPEAIPPSFPEPVPMNDGGAFNGTVIDLIIPAEFSDLLAEDANADVEFDGVVLDSDCVRGLLGLQLKEARVTISDQPLSILLMGEFTATRQGATCTFE